MIFSHFWLYQKKKQYLCIRIMDEQTKIQMAEYYRQVMAGHAYISVIDEPKYRRAFEEVYHTKLPF